MEEKLLDVYIDDALIEKPYPFAVTGKHGARNYCLYPVTMGKLHILKRHLDALGINQEQLTKNLQLEALRLVSEHREEVCRILVYHTLKTKDDLFDNEEINRRTEFFMDSLEDSEVAALFIQVITSGNAEVFKQHLGITKENERLASVIRAKNRAQKSKSDYGFGGKSIYGALIDVACERYGWTYDYVVWGISFVNLQMLIADRVQSIYLTDDEKKRVPSSLLTEDKEVVRATKENMETIKSMDWR